MSKPSSALPARSRPFVTFRHHDVPDVVGVAQPQDDAVAELAGEAEHPGREGGDVDRQLGAWLVAPELERGAEALALRRILAAQDRPDHARVLAHVAHRLLERLAVPALDHRLVGDAYAQDGAAAGHLVDRRDRLGARHRGARVDRHHAGPEADALRRAGVGGEHRERVAPRDVRDVRGVVAELLGAAHPIDRALKRPAHRDEGAHRQEAWQHNRRWSGRYWRVAPGGGWAAPSRCAPWRDAR